ncbi:MAG: hypothetical protein OXR66_06435 [Candidatus Woesearchaeota archaeon]|nr:hypothetical protein [Candidatus Woesearchaeota archaeon]
MTVAVRASAWRNSKERIVERAVASVQSLRAQDLKDYQALVGDGYVSEQLHIHFELPMLPFYVEDPFFNSRESPIAALSRVSVSPNVVRHGYKELARHAAYCHPSRHVDTSFESPSCVAGPTAQKAVQRAVYILNRREKALDFER